MSARSRRRALAPVLLGLALALATAALVWLLAGGQDSGGLPQREHASPASARPLADAPPEPAPEHERSAARRPEERVADERNAPDAPPAPDFLPPRPVAALTDAERRERVAQTAAWLDTVAQAATRRDWNAVRQAAREAEGALPDSLALALETLDAPGTGPTQALAAGLVFEEAIDGGRLTEDERFALGERLVPQLAGAIANGTLRGEARDHGLRLLSRFPGEQAEQRLLALLADPSLPHDARVLVLMSLAEVGSEAAARAADAIVWNETDPELVRVAALCRFRILAREGGGRLAPAERSRLATRLEPLLEAAVGRDDLEGASALAFSLAEIVGLPPAHYLAALAADRRFATASRRFALETLATLGDPSVLPTLERLRDRLDEPALEPALLAAIAALDRP